jgi:hypothetical protein
MSSAGSSSVGNMPPRHGKKLADVLEEAFKTNSRFEEDSGVDEKREEASAATPEKVPVIEQPKGYTVPLILAPSSTTSKLI